MHQYHWAAGMWPWGWSWRLLAALVVMPWLWASPMAPPGPRAHVPMSPCVSWARVPLALRSLGHWAHGPLCHWVMWALGPMCPMCYWALRRLGHCPIEPMGPCVSGSVCHWVIGPLDTWPLVPLGPVAIKSFGSWGPWAHGSLCQWALGSLGTLALCGIGPLGTLGSCTGALGDMGILVQGL